MEDFTDTESEFDEAERVVFPKAKFTLCMSLDEMSDLLSEKTSIVIKSTYSCYCYAKCPRPSEYFAISGKKLTYRFVIEELIRLGLNLDDCNHNFLEGFFPKTEVQFNLITGS